MKSVVKNPGIAKHSAIEDFLAFVTGTLLVSLGVFYFKEAGLLTGGTAGAALLMAQVADIPFGVVFFTLNLPFYCLAYRRMGLQFTLKTVLAVTMVSGVTELLPRIMVMKYLYPVFGGIAGGLLLGVGMLILFRHRASLGGFNILALFLQEKFDKNAGKFQLSLDGIILIASFFIVSRNAIFLSILGAIILNLSIALNHRPGRYVGMS